MPLVLRSPLPVLVALVLAAGAVVLVRPSFLPRAAGDDPDPSDARCYFQFDMRLLRAEIPDQVGDCLENQHYNPENGDALQRTTGGLMVWRRRDRTVAFTDGARTWAHGPNGLETRRNDQRFEWEAPAEDAASSTVVARPALATTSPAVATVPPARQVLVTTPEATAGGAVAGLAAALPNPSQLVASATELAVISALKASGLPVQNPQALTADTDPSRLLGKPGQYTSKIVWRDARASAEDAALEMFPDDASLRTRLQALDAGPRRAPQEAPYLLVDPPHKTVVRLPRSLAPDQAQGYQRWLSTLR